MTVIVDETADLADAARKIAASKTFDNATSCSSENAVIVVDASMTLSARSSRLRRPLLDGRPSGQLRPLWSGRQAQPRMLAKDIDG